MQRQQRRRPEAHAAAHGRCGDHIPFRENIADARFLFSVLRAGFLEICGESNYILEQSGQKHYMKGGKPGFYPSIKTVMPHPVPLDLFDPFGLQGKMSPEKKEKSLLAEINNGRLAMLGIMAFLAESKVPGAVPALTGLVKPYSGEVMAPFAAGDAGLPFVSDMLKVTLF